mgnify:CR=1 FL=1
MKTIKGPAIFLAQFMGEQPPFDTLTGLADWAAGLGFRGLQLPTDPRLFDLTRAAASQDYCDEISGLLAERGLVITELSTHLQGQLLAVHPAYDALFDGFAPAAVRGKPAAAEVVAATAAPPKSKPPAAIWMSAKPCKSCAICTATNMKCFTAAHNGRPKPSVQAAPTMRKPPSSPAKTATSC